MPTENRGSREDQRELTLTVEGFNTGIWDRKSGGAKKAQSVKHRRGGMGESFSLGGPSEYDDITLMRDYDLTRDLPIDAFLDKWTGSGDILLTEQYLDKTKATKGKAITWIGTLKEYTGPDANSDTNAVAMMTVVLEITAKNSGQ